MNGVVITGIGVISPLGFDAAEIHHRLCRMESAAAPITGFDPGPFPTKHGCQIKGFQGKDWIENRKNLKLMTPAVQYGLAAIKLAVQSAALTPQSTPPERLGMFVGAVILSVVTTASTGLLLSPDWQFILKGSVTFVAILAQRFALERRQG